jgi:chromosomal replication initiator protein
MPGIGQRVTPRLLFFVAERIYGVKPAELKSPSKKAELVRIRQSMMYILRMKTGMYLQNIGEEFGNRDHSTVIHACDCIKSAIKGYNNPLLEVYNNLISKMYDNM